MALYCTILAGRDGSPHRYYHSARKALEAAQRYCKARGAGVEVAWCKARGNPKLWLAYVTPEGTCLTQFLGVRGMSADIPIDWLERLDIREQITRIDKSIDEAAKLRAEARKFNRERWVIPITVLGALLAAIVARLPEILRAFGWAAQ